MPNTPEGIEYFYYLDMIEHCKLFLCVLSLIVLMLIAILVTLIKKYKRITKTEEKKNEFFRNIFKDNSRNRL